MSDALPTALEKSKDRFICTPARTHKRISSPRLAASAPQNKVVGESAKYIRNFGKELALRVGFGCRVDSRLVTVDGQGTFLEAFPVR